MNNLTPISIYEEFYQITSRAIQALPQNLEEASQLDTMTIKNMILINRFEVFAEALTVALNEFEGAMRRS
ncbi:hypothetical protein [Vagococcus intermedius]|uniref:Uncharacterized protein n=1 Tax=Vagococcus intermedius TaxID=2991418 RepID=A0AAF0CV29_9ENTE|nr:hypothetical protein [Vagococcus intermedius]WEG73494.1 hypothetical protein OL234_00880 [Vagococcus intermedius]WEG75576.1 hypothetical protein OL235_00885 [Vagococcus intermedius]